MLSVQYTSVKVFPYSLPSVGPGADPGVQAVSRRWREVNHAIDPAVGCHNFLPGLRFQYKTYFIAFQSHEQLRGAAWQWTVPCRKQTEIWIHYIEGGVLAWLSVWSEVQMAQLMPLPLTVSCSSKIQIGFTFLVPPHPGCPGKEAVTTTTTTTV